MRIVECRRDLGFALKASEPLGINHNVNGRRTILISKATANPGRQSYHGHVACRKPERLALLLDDPCSPVGRIGLAG
jgi:hypothetical protein